MFDFVVERGVWERALNHGVLGVMYEEKEFNGVITA